METVCDSVAVLGEELRDGLLVSFSVFAQMLGMTEKMGNGESHVPRFSSGEYVVQTFEENVEVHS